MLQKSREEITKRNDAVTNQIAEQAAQKANESAVGWLKPDFPTKAAKHWDESDSE